MLTDLQYHMEKEIRHTASKNTEYTKSGNISQCSSVSIVSDYGLKDQGLIPSRGKDFFISLLHPDWL
jgi:hypothetical protein